MTDTTERVGAPGSTSSGRTSRNGRTGATGLATMNVVELKRLASGLGITGTTKMRKDDLVAAISARQVGGPTRAPRSDDATAAAGAPSRNDATASATSAGPATSATSEPAQTGGASEAVRAPASGDEADKLQFDRRDGRDSAQRQPGTALTRQTDRQAPDRAQPLEQNRDQSPDPGREPNRAPAHTATRSDQRDQRDQRDQHHPQQALQQRQGAAPRTQTAQTAQPGQSSPSAANAPAQQDTDDDGRGGRRRSRQRSRDRKRGRTPATGGQEYESELQINDDDVLVPVAGILDVLDNYAFVRTSGYLPGANDVYVPLGLVKKYGLRKGDAVTGSIKAPRDGEQAQNNGPATRQKFNALVRLDSINGAQPDLSRNRVEFGKLTPLYPQERLRLETEVGQLTTRVIDLVAPVGKGQRGLVVAPAKAGKTMVLQAIANAITANNPECHLMVVLVDERPEEVTDMQRAVKGEVIASTFDRPADDHTSVAELAIERAKRLVELGHDVVVLLDSITKLGRAYNLAAPASGRILSGGVDSAALYPPKKFFGAARNIENGGSLTIIATALVETGSRMDEVIFEEFKGTGNMELKLSRDLADRRIFPAVDVNASGTRREEILLGPEELKIMWKLRRVLGALDPQQSLELLLDRLKRTRTNIEFLRQVQMSSSAKLDADD